MCSDTLAYIIIQALETPVMVPETERGPECTPHTDSLGLLQILFFKFGYELYNRDFEVVARRFQVQVVNHESCQLAAGELGILRILDHF
jgi:hypothetical protein